MASAKRRCDLCNHNIGTQKFVAHQEACANRSPEEREAHFRSIQKRRASNKAWLEETAAKGKTVEKTKRPRKIVEPKSDTITKIVVTCAQLTPANARVVLQLAKGLLDVERG